MGQRAIGTETDDTAFGDVGSLIAQLKRSQFPQKVQASLDPARGVSRLRDETTITDSSGSATIEEVDGEIRLQTGNDGSDALVLETREPFQYRSGTYANPSLGIRPEKQPDGQVMRWGYFNDNSGVGWGYDADGIFTFKRESGTDTIHRPPNSSTSSEKTWNADPLDGSGDSGITLDPQAGNVFDIIGRFYGYGPILWGVEAKDTTNERAPEIIVDGRVYADEINQNDFNRPLRVELDNSGTASGIALYVGGRQFSVLGDEGTVEDRKVTTIARGVDIGSADTWENVMAIRKKPNDPVDSSRTNTIRALLRELEILATQNVEVRALFDSTTDLADTDYTQPEGWPAAETGTESVLASNTSFTMTTDGVPIAHQVATGSQRSDGAAEDKTSIPIGTTGEVVVQARSPTSSADAITTLGVTVLEQW